MEVVESEMMAIASQLQTHPVNYYECIEACFESANASWICADGCLNEKEMMELRNCVEACLTTAEICAATARILARGEEYPFEQTLRQLKDCIVANMETAEECLKFADRHEHCLISARSAENCYKICMHCVQELEAS